MYIKKYDYYKFKYYGSSMLDFRYEDNDNIPYCVTEFLKVMYPLHHALGYKQYMPGSDILFETTTFYDLIVILDKPSQMVYMAQFFDKDYQHTSPGITSEMIIDICKQGEADFDILSFDNFTYLFERWVQFLENDPTFILLYQDHRDWYDLIHFETEETMRQFVADHLQ
jgi:hypothetical protein